MRVAKHIERVFGRIKNFIILSETLPISLPRLANQIVCVLINFQPALVPPPVNLCDIEEYFGSLPDSAMKTLLALKACPPGSSNWIDVD